MDTFLERGVLHQLRLVILISGVTLVASCSSPIGQSSNPSPSPSRSIVQTPSVSPSLTSHPTHTATPEQTDTATLEPSSTPTTTPTRTVHTQSPTQTRTVTLTIGPIGQVQLGVYDLVMAYKTNRWQEYELDALGHKELTHTVFPDCQIQEYGPGHILGDFKYRLGLGEYLFSIYEYPQEGGDEEILRREYVIERQAIMPIRTPEPTAVAKPAFLVTAPKSYAEDCIVSVHVVLATLHEPARSP